VIAIGHVWAIRSKLQIEGRRRDLALFNPMMVSVRIEDLAPNGPTRSCDGASDEDGLVGEV